MSIIENRLVIKVVPNILTFIIPITISGRNKMQTTELVSQLYNIIFCNNLIIIEKIIFFTK